MAIMRREAKAKVFTLTLVAVLAGLFAVSCRSRDGEQSQSVLEEQKLRGRVATLTRQEQILSAELSIAKSPELYLLVDFLNRKIDLKVQGRSLRSFDISEVSRSSRPTSAVEIWSEIEAKPLQAPDRAKMVPGSGEETTSSIATSNPWGPKRMPADYDLICKEDRAVGIRSLASTQSRSGFSRWIIGRFRQGWNWTRNTLGRKKSAYRESLEIWLAEDDAQLLFWSLPKQFGILLVLP
jgi:hypothetical protein